MTSSSRSRGKLAADLVVEGGGVKGLGAAGAVMRLLDAGYRFPRIAGTSVGALVAAVVSTGVDSDGLRDVMRRLDLTRIPDRASPGLPLVSEGISLVTGRGAYQGDYLRDFIYETLAERGITTFRDLRRRDRGDDQTLRDDQRYSLVVMATDITRGRLLRLPWDYRLFHLEPDEQLVADAVRMSLSIPIYFEPCHLTDPVTGKTSVIVDGGVLSNFPIEIFDRADSQRPRWPTFGLRLFPDLPAGLGDVFPVFALPMLPWMRLLEEVVATAIVGRDQTHLELPGVRDRTITVDTSGVGITEFRLNDKARERLLANGWDAADAFLRDLEPLVTARRES